jgi:gluconate 2-dehydrogenase alpha chain
MGSDPASSAVNSYLQMWEAENVFVVGACNFPQNAGFNPTGRRARRRPRRAAGEPRSAPDR